MSRDGARGAQDGTRSYYFTTDELEAMFTACGFETVRSGYREGRTVNHRKQVSSSHCEATAPRGSAARRGPGRVTKGNSLPASLAHARAQVSLERRFVTATFRKVPPACGAGEG